MEYIRSSHTNYNHSHIGDDLLTKDIRNSARWGRVSRIRRQQYYYTSHNLFEQSLDVYWPEHDCRVDLVILLTVGSGWMGHQPWVYLGTSWWNSSGPKTIASALNCPCVCIRHRGAYIHLPDWPTLLGYCLLLLFHGAILVSALLWHKYDHQTHKIALLLPFIVLSTCVFLKWTSLGSANMDDMVHDVATAIAWVQQNKDKVLGSSGHPKFKNHRDHHHHHHHRAVLAEADTPSTGTECQMIFGGYSSGAHVSAILLQKPAEYWKRYGLPTPDKLFSAIMYISGVLAT